MNTYDALTLVLEHADWTHTGKADFRDPLCAALPDGIIRIARKALDQAEDEKLNRELRESIEQLRVRREGLLDEALELAEKT